MSFVKESSGKQAAVIEMNTPLRQLILRTHENFQQVDQNTVHYSFES